jgi:hypothetical protein
MVSRREVNHVASDKFANALGAAIETYVPPIFPATWVGKLAAAGTAGCVAYNFPNVNEAVGHSVIDSLAGATVTNRYPDGSYMVEGDGYTIWYDRNGKEISTETGQYFND